MRQKAYLLAFELLLLLGILFFSIENACSSEPNSKEEQQLEEKRIDQKLQDQRLEQHRIDEQRLQRQQDDQRWQRRSR